MVKKKLFISTVAAVVAATCVVPTGMDIVAEAATPKFSDVLESNSHYAAIMDLASRGIIKGYADGTFAPEKQVTRGQAAKMIVGILGLDTGNVANAGFRDVSPQNEYAGAIATLKQAGIIDGYADGTFRPNESIKRNHMAKIITRALSLEGSASVELPFTDLHSDYKEAISTLFEYGITTGTTATTFGGENFVARGQLASFIVRAERAVQAIQSDQPEKEKASAEIVLETLTIEEIKKDKVKAEDQEWTIGANVQAMLNERNAAALEGARIDVIFVEGEIADLVFIELNTSGQQGANITLDGGNSIFTGNITVNADFVELKNMIITENVVLTDRAKTNVAINQVEVKGELIIQERAPIVTASLTNVATQFFVTEEGGGLTLSVHSSVLGRVSAAGSATINSDGSIPYAVIFPTIQIIINAPRVGVADFYLGQSTEVSGTAMIDNLILRSPEDLQKLFLQLLNQQQGLLMEQQVFLERSQQQGLLSNSTQQQMQTTMNELKKKLEQIKQQQEQANQQGAQQGDSEMKPNVIIGGSLSIGNLLVGTPQANISLQPSVRITNVRATVPLEQLRRMIGAQPGQITNFITAANTQVPYNTPSSNSSTDNGSSSDSSSGSSTDTGLTNTDLIRLQQAIVEAKSGLVEVSVDGSTIAIHRQWTTAEVKAKFSEVLEEAERTAAKVNVTNSEALTAYNKLIVAKRVYDAAKQYGTMKLSTESLANYISMAKWKLAEFEESILREDLAISNNGQDIPQSKQWIPRSVKEAFATTIADAEKMKANAESGEFQRVASLTDMNILLANTNLSQEDLNKMAEKLEKLMNVQPLNGLQEVFAVQSLLSGQQITVPNDEITNHTSIFKEIKNLIGQDYPLTEEQLEIDNNQVTVTLHEAITYLNPETFEFTELIPAITAQVTIIPEISLDTATFTQNGLILTASNSITVDVGEVLTFTVDGQSIEGTVAVNQATNEIRIEFVDSTIQPTNIITAISSENYQFKLPSEGLTVVQG
ncbi:S-layer homology domain-containing protein [Lysinibacillus sp. NPDC096418]|uniref:S-layer homology domain-containing protein n=1 Tax=Lysinibacillus sp. NPDC096418 TaxID=3364138 RepID=UPI0037FCEDBE